MYVVRYNEDVNGLYIKLTTYIDPDEVDKVVLYIKDVVRSKLKPGFTSIVDLTDVTIDRVDEHFAEIRQAIIVVSIKKVGRIIRIGDNEVLKLFSKIYDEYYAYKADAPKISTCSSIEECIASNPELDLWFHTSLCNVVVLD